MNIQVKKSTISQKQVLLPLIKYFVREDLKLKNSVIDNVCWIVHRQHELLPYLNKLEKNRDYELSESEIVDLGNLLFSSKELWPLMLILSILEQISEGREKNTVLEGMQAFLKMVQKKELMQLWMIPSIINVGSREMR